MATRTRTQSNLRLQMPKFEQPEEVWWDGTSSTSESIDEDGASEASEYYLNLGAETPCSTPPNLFETTEFVERWAAAGIAVPKLVRKPSYRPAITAAGRDPQRSKILKDEFDRDCGICFEYAVEPLRTYCCGKIFCKEHLEDWLHGPNAEGRCPNCENACSLEGGTLSLAPPALIPSSVSRPRTQQTSLAPKGKQQSNAIPLCYYSSSLLSYLNLNPNDNLKTDESWAKRQTCGGTVGCTCLASPTLPARDYKAPGDVSPSNSTVSAPTSEGTTSTSASSTKTRLRSAVIDKRKPSPNKLDAISGSNLPASTTPYASSWGAMGRLMSTVTFLMFLYKLLS